jgi:mannose-1-phosphate guanylyltransferase
MKALFLAGGLGEKLRPLTDEIPKPMLPIMNKPLLERSMTALKECGITEIVISTSYNFKCIEKYFGDGSRFDLKIDYVYEDFPLGTGGAVKKAAQLLDDSFLVFNADIFCDINLKEFIDFHKSKNADVTIAAANVKDTSGCISIECDENGFAKSFVNGEKGNINSNFIDAGIYVINSNVLDEISDDRPVSIKRELFPSLLQNGRKIAVYKTPFYWIDLETPEKYLQAHRDIMSGACKISGLDFTGNGIYKDGKAMVESSAIIKGPAYIGDNVKIGAYVTVGPNAVIGDDVSIHMGGKVVDSILWNNVNIGMFAKLDTAIAASDCKIERKKVYNDTAFTTSESVEW